jgi:hypothetical protein
MRIFHFEVCWQAIMDSIKNNKGWIAAERSGANNYSIEQCGGGCSAFADCMFSDFLTV